MILIINKLVSHDWPIRKKGIVMLENNNKIVHEITKLVNEVKYNLSKEINNKIIYVYGILVKLLFQMRTNIIIV